MKRKLGVIITILCMAANLLAGCANAEAGNAEIEENVSTAESETTQEETKEVAPVTLVLAENGVSEYKITYPDKVLGPIRMAAKYLQDEMEAATGVKPESGKENAKDSAGVKEIILGVSGQKALAGFYEDLGYGDWAVGVVEEKVLIAGRDVTAFYNAFDYFRANFLTEDTITIQSDFYYEYKPEHAVESIRIDGKDIAEYKIVYATAGGGEAKQAANDLQMYIGDASGIMTDVVEYKEGVELTDAIVVGINQVHPIETMTYGDCNLYAKEGTIYVDGTDICGLESGVSYLASVLTAQKEVNLDSKSLSFTDSLQDRGVYENDPDAFLPCYRYSYSVPEEEITFAYKVNLINDPSARTMVLAHRGEHVYYPENSLEANISAYLCGADSTEIDVQTTKDGVMVLMHDSTMSRTTNVGKMKGTNGLPRSEAVQDWTFEELRQLRLLDSYDDETPFLIPSLEEILIACDNRIFVHLDKNFDYEQDIFSLMEKNEIYNNVYLSNRAGYDFIVANRNRYEEQGVTLQNLMRTGDSATFEKYAIKLTTEEPEITPALVYINDYDKNQKDDKELVKKYAGQLRIASWMMYGDFELYWREAQDYGFNFLMTNYPMAMLRDIKSR